VLNDPVNLVDRDGLNPEYGTCHVEMVRSTVFTYTTIAVGMNCFWGRGRSIGSAGGGGVGGRSSSGRGGKSNPGETSNSLMRKRGLTFIREELGEGCKSFLRERYNKPDDTDILVNISNKLEETMFWSVSYSGIRKRKVSSLPGVEGEFRADTIESYYGLGLKRGATPVKNLDGIYFNHVIHRGHLTGADVFHELLHIVLGDTDVGLANTWEIREKDFTDTNEASDWLRAFIDPGRDCKTFN
jgi:hypothetical protein